MIAGSFAARRARRAARRQASGIVGSQTDRKSQRCASPHQIAPLRTRAVNRPAVRREPAEGGIPPAIQEDSRFEREPSSFPPMMRPFRLALLTTLALPAPATDASAQTRLLRTPSLSATDIAFAYANNIW